MSYVVLKLTVTIFDIMFSWFLFQMKKGHQTFSSRFITRLMKSLLLKVTCRLEAKEAAPQVILVGVTLAQSTGRTSAQSFQSRFYLK